MALTVRRLFRNNPASVNQGNQRSATLTYRVGGQPFNNTQKMVLDNTGIVGLPSRLDPHPDFPTLLARQFTVSPGATSDEAVVDILYTTSNFPGAGLLHAVPDTSGSNFVLSVSYETVDVQIPFAEVETYTASVDGQQQDLTAWRVRSEPVEENRTVLRARWQMYVGTANAETFEAYRQQNGKIHELPNGQRYVFNVGSITPRDNLIYEVNASWTDDPGTKGVASADLARYLTAWEMPYFAGQHPADVWPEDGSLMRSPFHYLQVRPATNPDAEIDNPASYPWVSQVPRYVEDLNGWRQFVGVPW